MKSIEIYRRNKNIREKGMDGMDTALPPEIPEEFPMTNIFTARCYILWGEYHKRMWRSESDHRVYHEGKAKTICVELVGNSREEALTNLDTNKYEFIEWW